MTRKLDRQNQQPSIESARKRPGKTEPNRKKVDSTSQENQEVIGAFPDCSVIEMPYITGAFEPPLEGASEYHFDITEYSNENLRRIEARIRTKGRGQTWDFFDPEDLANLAMTELWKDVIKDPGRFLEKISIDKMLSTIVVRIWVDEVRREFQETNLLGSGNVCVSLFGALNEQVAQLGLEFEVALRELLEHVKANLSPRHRQIVDLLLEGQNQLDISLILFVSESTIDREIVSLKKAIVSKLGEQRTTNNEQRTTNNEQRTTNNEQRGCNPS